MSVDWYFKDSLFTVILNIVYFSFVLVFLVKYQHYEKKAFLSAWLTDMIYITTNALLCFNFQILHGIWNAGGADVPQQQCASALQLTVQMHPDGGI